MILRGEWREARVIYFTHVITPVSRESERLRQIFHQHALGVGGEVGKVGNRRAERASGTIGRASGARDGEGEGVALYGHSGRVYGVDRGAVGDLGSEHLAGHVRLVGAHRVEKGSVPVEP